MNTKICGTCNEEKDLSEFYTITRKDGSLYYRRECKKCVYLRSQKWQRDNPEAYAKSRKKKESKPARVKYLQEYSKMQRETGITLEWQRNNPDKLREYREARQHKDHKITKEEWLDCKNYFDNSCAYCGIKQEDHFVKRKGEMKNIDLHKEHVDYQGSSDLSNCVPACQSCNSSKHTATLDDWYNIDNPNYTKRRYNKIMKWIDKDHNKYIKPTVPKGKYVKNPNCERWNIKQELHKTI